MSENNTLPILYSLRNCPYAMRARIAIFKAKQPVLLRDIVLSDKPNEMIVVSPKATVPVLVVNPDVVIDESLDIMLWALKNTDPQDLLHQEDDANLLSMLALIELFDTKFKACLNKYKCAKRYRENNVEQCRQDCQYYINLLEERLTQHTFLFSDKESLADIALLPLIRQFAKVERQWFLNAGYPNLQKWLSCYLQSPMFTKVMSKYDLWLTHKEDVLFGC